jgi:DNA-binding MarR family transcriptional regulator
MPRRISHAKKRVKAEPELDMPECICGALRMATRAITQLYDDAMRPSGLRVTQYSLLSRIERLQPISAAALESSLYFDQTTLARALKVLEKDGLIRRVTNPDKRIKRIELTALGRKRVEHARKLWVEAQGRMVGQIGKDTWKGTRDGLLRLVDAAAADPPAP